MVEPDRRPDLTFEPLFADELNFLLPRGHAWTTKPEVTPEEIAHATLIVPNKTTRTHQLMAGYLRSRRITMERYIEPGSIESIKELVRNGLGVGVVAQWAIRAELQSGELVARPIGRTPLVRRWYAVHLRGRPLNEAEKAFVRFFREAATKLAGTSEIAPAAAPVAVEEPGAVLA
jgi:DNA-binding transcriptional LysR family regulator